MVRFSHYDQLMQAAIEGQGIALGRSRFVSKWVSRQARPALRQALHVLPADSRASFSCARRSGAPRSRIRQWLQQQALEEDAEWSRRSRRTKRAPSRSKVAR